MENEAFILDRATLIPIVAGPIRRYLSDLDEGSARACAEAILLDLESRGIALAYDEMYVDQRRRYLAHRDERQAELPHL